MTTIRYGKPSELRGAKPGQGTGAPAKGTDGRMAFAAGASLFAQGDPGGDLFFIEQGSVEIFTRKEDQDIMLAVMKPGEIIGVMTCLTSEARMASARAKDAVVCKKVPHERIKKVLAALPNWMKIVLKEFTIRLTEMNKLYSDAAMKIRRLEMTQVTSVYTGAQLAVAFGTVAEFMTIRVDDAKVVVVDEVLKKLEAILNVKKEEIDRIFGVLLEAGLIRLEIEADRKRTVTKLENAQKLAFFAQFVRESKQGATKKLLKAKFTHKETRVMSAIVKFAQRLNMDMEKTCKFSLVELKGALERATGVKFDRDALAKGAALKLLALQGEGATEVVVFKPSHLGRTVACLEAIRKLTNADHPGDQEIAA